MKKKEALDIIFRYLILIALSPFILSAIYFVFTPLTVYPAFFILNLIYPSSSLVDLTAISIQDSHISLIPACIAGSAYLLLFLLNLTAPMPLLVRIKSLAFTFGSFLILNILRVSIFIILFVIGFKYFDLAHLAFWYIGSTLLVVLIWFINIRIFKIKGIPAYSDIKALLKESKYKSKYMLVSKK